MLSLINSKMICLAKLNLSLDYLYLSKTLFKLTSTLYGPESLKPSQEFKTLSEGCKNAIKEHKQKTVIQFCESIHLLATALIEIVRIC